MCQLVWWYLPQRRNWPQCNRHKSVKGNERLVGWGIMCNTHNWQFHKYAIYWCKRAQTHTYRGRYVCTYVLEHTVVNFYVALFFYYFSTFPCIWLLIRQHSAFSIPHSAFSQNGLEMTWFLFIVWNQQFCISCLRFLFRFVSLCYCGYMLFIFIIFCILPQGNCMRTHTHMSSFDACFKIFIVTLWKLRLLLAMKSMGNHKSGYEVLVCS